MIIYREKLEAQLHCCRTSTRHGIISVAIINLLLPFQVHSMKENIYQNMPTEQKEYYMNLNILKPSKIKPKH